MMIKKKKMTIEQLKDLGIADHYGNIDGAKFRKYAEEQNAEGYDIIVDADSGRKDYNILDNEPITYGKETIKQDVTILRNTFSSGN